MDARLELQCEMYFSQFATSSLVSGGGGERDKKEQKNEISHEDYLSKCGSGHVYKSIEKRIKELGLNKTVEEVLREYLKK